MNGDRMQGNQCLCRQAPDTARLHSPARDGSLYGHLVVAVQARCFHLLRYPVSLEAKLHVSVNLAWGATVGITDRASVTTIIGQHGGGGDLDVQGVTGMAGTLKGIDQHGSETYTPFARLTPILDLVWS